MKREYTPTVADTNPVAGRYLAEAPKALASLIRRLHAKEANDGHGTCKLAGRTAYGLYEAIEKAGKSYKTGSAYVSGRWGALSAHRPRGCGRSIFFFYTSSTREVWESR